MAEKQLRPIGKTEAKRLTEQMLRDSEKRAGEFSVIRSNAEEDPAYCPYCMRCRGLVRMKKVEPFYWRCMCGAEHDEREPAPQGGSRDERLR